MIETQHLSRVFSNASVRPQAVHVPQITKETKEKTVLQLENFPSSTNGSLPSRVELPLVIQAAWAIVLRSYTAFDHVRFAFSIPPKQAAENGFGRVCEDDAGIHDFSIDSSTTIKQLLLLIQESDINRTCEGHQPALPMKYPEVSQNSTTHLPDSIVCLDDQEHSAERNGYTTEAKLQSRGTRDFDIAIHFSQSDTGSLTSITMEYSTTKISGQQAGGIARTVEKTLHELVAHPNATVGDLEICSDADLDCIASWNQASMQNPPPENCCVHDVLSKQCFEHPNNAAISAWDGELTYAELHQYSNAVALRLVDMGVGPEVFVPICFDKSKWAVIAALGVLQAGGAYVFLDPSHPLQRNRKICDAVCASTAVCSPNFEHLMKQLDQNVLSLGDGCWISDADLTASRARPTSVCSPKTAMYAIFTSGSTGEPKGVVTEHGAFLTVAQANGRALRLGPNSRALQFASYTFDVSNRDIFTTLLFGGCICIPSDSDRINDLAGFVDRFNVNHASLTASIACIASSSCIANLHTLVLGGEPLNQDLINALAGKVHLVNAYGVSENTGIATLASPVQPGTSPQNIGFGCGATVWIVDAENPDRLVPVGAVGEIVLQGHGLARSYLGEKERTARSFLDVVAWQEHVGSDKNGRYYRTGDLARYNLDGSIHYIGRKDSQIKLNGQRLEPTEIEHHIWTWPNAPILGVQKTAVVSTANPVQLVAFLDLGLSEGGYQQMEIVQQKDARSWINSLVQYLSSCLPRYMIPGQFAFVRNIPLTRSGKINRLQLREIAQEAVTTQQDNMVSVLNETLEPAIPKDHTRTRHEKVLQTLWSKALDIPHWRPRQWDNLFRRGGSSITAIKLVTLLRAEGLGITVSEVFEYPTLSSMASVVRKINPSIEHGQDAAAPVPFSLMGNHQDSIVDAIAAELALPKHQIEDVYPCTPFQEGAFALSTKALGAYICRYSWKLPDEIDHERFKAAWQSTWAMNPILRTRLVQIPQGAFQVVMRETLLLPWVWVSGENVQSSTLLNGPLLRCAVSSSSDSIRAGHYFHLDIHHALFDDWSLNLLLDQVERAYRGHALELRPLNSYIKHILANDALRAQQFWRAECDGLETEHFPFPPVESGDDNKGKEIIEHSFDWEPPKDSSYTVSSILKLAWAIVLHQQTGCDDVVFGSTVTGRSASLTGIDQISGPTIATVPLRVKLQWNHSVGESLAAIQGQFSRMIEFEQTGLHRIRQAGHGPAVACEFQNILLVQSEATVAKRKHGLFMNTASPGNLAAFTGSPLMLVCNPREASISLQASFDVDRIASHTVTRMLHQTAHVCRQIRDVENVLLADINLVTPDDHLKLRQWNTRIPEEKKACIVDLIRIQFQTQPEAPAVHGHDCTLTYSQLDHLSTRFSTQLKSMGITKGSFVPLLFEKSGWTPVAMLAVLKSGAAFVMLESTYPIQRLKAICSESAAQVIVTSEACAATGRILGPQVLIIGNGTLQDESPVDTIQPSTSAAPQDPAYVIFTSGTTGKPKGIVVHHSAISSSAQVHCEQLLLGPHCRVFQFSSYAFDVSVGDHLFSLVAGACICIPSEYNRKSDPGRAASDLRVNWAVLTPSVMSLIDPSQIPGLEILVSIGEPLTVSLIQTWADRVHLINTYGPAECSVFSNVQRELERTSDPSNIGTGSGAVCWIVDQNDHNKLVPLGAVGELVLEGPIVGLGYLNDHAKTEAAFIKSPPWLRGFRDPLLSSSRLYKTGDLVCYGSNGTLRFIGRKDLQVKLHGQRIELAEIEHHLHSFPKVVEAVAEVVKIEGRPILLAFVRPRITDDWWWTGDSSSMDQVKIAENPTQQFSQDVSELALWLNDHVPSYMVPSAFIPIAELPLTLSGKLNRRLLREHVSSWSMGQLQTYKRRSACQGHAPKTEREGHIQRMVATVLGLEKTQVQMDDSFLATGGDSITAMRLTALAKQEGIQLAVPHIFSCPTLSSLAAQSSSREMVKEKIMCQDHDRLLQTTKDYQDLYHTLPGINIKWTENIAGVLPTTEMQKMTLVNFYCRYLWIPLPADIDQGRLLKACQAVVRAHSCLRTVFAQHARDGGVFQIVLRSLDVQFAQYHDVPDLERFCADDSLAMQNPADGNVVFQAQLVTLTDSRSFLSLRLTHAQFDALSLPVICEDLSAAYNGEPISPSAQFSEHLQSASAQRTDEGYRVWRSVLSDANMTTLENYRSQKSTANHNANGPRSPPVSITAKKEIPLVSPPTGITMATLVKTAWAVTLMQCMRITGPNQTKQDANVVFGQVIHGRSLGLPNEDRIVGPCLNIVPVRVRFSESATNMADLARQVQQQHVDTIPFENLGFQDIARQCTPWPAGTQFGSFIRFQNVSIEPTCVFDGCTTEETTLYSLPNRPSNTANVLVVPQEANFSVTMTISDQMLDQEAADSLLDHFGHAVRAVSESLV